MAVDGEAAASKGASEKSGVHDESVSIGLAAGEGPEINRVTNGKGENYKLRT